MKVKLLMHYSYHDSVMKLIQYMASRYVYLDEY